MPFLESRHGKIGTFLQKVKAERLLHPLLCLGYHRKVTVVIEIAGWVRKAPENRLNHKHHHPRPKVVKEKAIDKNMKVFLSFFKPFLSILIYSNVLQKQNKTKLIVGYTRSWLKSAYWQHLRVKIQIVQYMVIYILDK